jgi:hypothetical protein
MHQKNKHIRVRFEDPLYRFIARYGMKRNMTISDVIRNICTMLFVINEFNCNKKAIKSIFTDEKRKRKFMKFIDNI